MLTSTNSRDDYSGDGATRVWPITFPVDNIDADEIAVYYVESDGTENLVSTGVEVDLDTPQVTYPTVASGLAVLTSAESIVILRSLDLTQEADYVNEGAVPAESIEASLDRVVMMVQQLNENISRCITLSVSSSTTTDEYLEYLQDAIDDAQGYASDASDYADLALTRANAAQGTKYTFEDADLSSGELTITHNLGLSAPYVLLAILVDNNNKVVTPDEITFGTDTMVIDLSSFGTISGTWAVIYGGSPAAAVPLPDPGTGSENDQIRIDGSGDYELFTPSDELPDPTGETALNVVRVDASSTAYETYTLPSYLEELADDASPQLGGDLDLNGNAIDFPTTANIDDCLDEDNMASDSNTALATQQSIKAYVDAQGFPTYTNGTDGEEASADTERSTTSESYVKLKEFTPLIRAGNITVSWQMKKDDIGTAYAKVYVNGVAIGAEKSTTNTSYVDKSESDLAVSVGDVIQIYGKRAGGITQCIVQKAKIQCNNPTVPQEASGY
jgi:hypothetical protein